MKSTITKNCTVCNKEYAGHFNSKVCSDACHKQRNRTAQTKSRHPIPFTDNNSDEWVECSICNARMSGMNLQHLKRHNYSPEQYKKDFPDAVWFSKKTLQFLSEKVTGEKNMAYGHGGRLSPFSKKFVGYADDTEENKSEYINNIKKKVRDTKEKNKSNNNTTIEYYTSRGANIQDAIILLADRQSTFSLQKCIKKYGQIEGTVRWNQRQEKWLTTLSLRSIEEQQTAQMKKSTTGFRQLWSNYSDHVGYFYVIRIDSNRHKIGITTHTKIEDRYKIKDLRGTDVLIFSSMKNLSHAFYTEQSLKKCFVDFVSRSDNGNFGWTEVFHNIDESMLIEEANKYINSYQHSVDKFNGYYGS